MKKHKNKLNIFICIGLLLPLFLFMVKKDSTDYVIAAENPQKEVEFVEIEQKEVAMHTQLSDEEIINITNEFMSILVQDIDEYTYQVLNYHSKIDLIEHFQAITSGEIAELFVEYYYDEDEEGLYIMPTETPAWFVSENDYDLEQINEDQFKVTQYNETDFYGNYTIELEFTFVDTWKITDIVYL